MMCAFHGSNGNGLGDIWWTGKLFYFSIIDVAVDIDRVLVVSIQSQCVHAYEIDVQSSTLYV